MLYVPAGVPPEGGGVVELLPLLQAVMKMKPVIIMQTSRIPTTIFRRELKPAPSSVTPPIGSNNKAKPPAGLDAEFGVVLTVRDEGVPGVVEVGLNKQVG